MTETEAQQWMREAAKEAYEEFAAWLAALLRMETAYDSHELPVKFAEIIARHAPAAPSQTRQPPQEITLEISEWGRPVIWIAEYYYKCLPGTAVDHITNGCVFASRHEAVRWCKFELRDEIDWDTWQSGTADYPYLKNYDSEIEENKGLSPTFIATFEQTFGPETPLPGTISKQVRVKHSEVSGKFDWWAKTADGSWNK